MFALEDRSVPERRGPVGARVGARDLRRRAVLVLLAAALLLTGEPVVASPVGPLRELTADESDLLDFAEDILIADCMAERGFRYVPRRRDPRLRPWDRAEHRESHLFHRRPPRHRPIV